MSRSSTGASEVRRELYTEAASMAALVSQATTPRFRILIRGAAPHGNNTYKGMRIVSPQYDLLYTVWCSHEHELYDMKVGGPRAFEILKVSRFN